MNFPTNTDYGDHFEFCKKKLHHTTRDVLHKCALQRLNYYRNKDRYDMAIRHHHQIKLQQNTSFSWITNHLCSEEKRRILQGKFIIQ